LAELAQKNFSKGIRMSQPMLSLCQLKSKSSYLQLIYSLQHSQKVQFIEDKYPQWNKSAVMW
jgi:hypothetical protein